MKKHRLNLTLLGLFAAVAVACGPLQAPRDHKAAETPITRSQLPDSARLTVEEARRMVANYAPRAGYVERDGEQLANTRVAWVSMDYLCAMVRQLCQEGADGMHIYLAAYDSVYTDAAQHAPPREWWGYNTLVFTSTRDSLGDDGRHYHRDYFDHGTLGPLGGRSRSADGGFIVTMAPMNRVGLCPPPEKDCKRWGAILL